MKKTLQDQYLLIKEGKGHKGVFLTEAKREFPHIVRNAATFDEAVASLKTKNIILVRFCTKKTGFLKKKPVFRGQSTLKFCSVDCILSLNILSSITAPDKLLYPFVLNTK